MPHALAIIPFKWSCDDPPFLNFCLLCFVIVSQESRPMLHTMAPLINSSRGPAKKKEKTKMGLVIILGNAAMDGPVFQKANNFDKILPNIQMDLFIKKLIILARFCWTRAMYKEI